MVFRNPFRHKGAAEKAPPDPVADGPATGETGSAERVLRRLEWSVIRRLDGLLQGDYRTLMRGAGLDLADLREYQHHDDVATSTGTSPPGCRCRTCACSPKTARWRPGSCST